MFEKYMKLSSEDKMCYFFKNITPTNRTPSYYVNWNKVVANTLEFELELNTLNYLIGKKDIKLRAKELFSKQPNLLRAIPSLIASRDKKIDVLSINENSNMEFYDLDFRNINVNEIDDYIMFIEQSGLFEFLEKNANRSLVDYVYGVESGLDSNARKNRSGTIMEEVVEKSVKKTCKELGLTYKIQATSKWIFENWGVDVPVDKAIRRFDVAVFDKNHNKVYVLETNYYGGGGSKLKSVCGEFVTLNNLIKTSVDNVEFVWITDGSGWKTTRRALNEAFDEITNIFNLKMLQDNFLYELLKS